MNTFDTSIKPINFLDPIPLRRSSTFSNPGKQEILPIVIGSWLNEGTEAVLIDRQTNTYLWSGLPVQSITKVAVADSSGSIEEVHSEQSSFKFFPSTKDATGTDVALVTADNSLGDKKLIVYGTGLMFKNKLLENPADILEWLADYMHFSPDSLDLTKLDTSRFYFQRNKITLRYLIDSDISFKNFIDEVCFSCSSSLVIHRAKTWMQLINREGL